MFILVCDLQFLLSAYCFLSAWDLLEVIIMYLQATFGWLVAMVMIRMFPLLSIARLIAFIARFAWAMRVDVLRMFGAGRVSSVGVGLGIIGVRRARMLSAVVMLMISLMVSFVLINS